MATIYFTPSPRRIERQCKYCQRSFYLPQSVQNDAAFCSRECRTSWKSDPMFHLMQNRSIRPDTGCWEWTGPIDSWGYGQMRLNQKAFLVHRISANVFLDFQLNKELCVCHTCDNPRCFNPEHLFIGSQEDNQRDMISKNRQAGAVGSRNTKAKLTEDQVRVIRKRLDAGETLTHVATDFGISTSLASAIKRREVWKHLD